MGTTSNRSGADTPEGPSAGGTKPKGRTAAKPKSRAATKATTKAATKAAGTKKAAAAKRTTKATGAKRATTAKKATNNTASAKSAKATATRSTSAAKAPETPIVQRVAVARPSAEHRRLEEVEALVSAPIPRAVGESVVAPGRVLGWAEFGHPDGDPLLWFHGTPGARTQVPPAVDEVALQRGFRVIAVERPGTGRSTDHRYDRVLDFAADVEALADDLGLERFGVVGLSGGGPFTLAVARNMPDRVVVACTLGGIGPLRGPDAVMSYMRLLRFGAPMLEVLRTPLGAALGSLVGFAERIGEQAVVVFGRLIGGSDAEILSNPQFKAMFIGDLVGAGELRAVAHDLALFSRHWGFLLEEVEPPVVVWQGLADTIVPQSHGHHMAARLPDAQLRVRPGEGHFAGFSDVVAVLDSIREVWAHHTASPV